LSETAVRRWCSWVAFHAPEAPDVEPFFSLSPVIRWREGKFGPEAITNGNYEDVFFSAIVYPNGEVYAEGADFNWESVDQWKGYALSEYDAHLELCRKYPGYAETGVVSLWWPA